MSALKSSFEDNSEKAAPRFLDTGDGHRLYWQSFGNPDGAPLLLIHGGNGHVIDVAKLSAIPLDKYNVFVMHQRGIGLSEPLGKIENNTIARNIEDIETLRRHVGIDKWDIFSWSFGAIFMAGYAAQYPAHCGNLMAYAPYFGTEEEWQGISRKDPGMAQKFFAHHGADNATDYTRNVFNQLSGASRETWLQSLYNSHVAEGGQQSYTEFTASKKDADWDRKFKESLVGAWHEKVVLNDYPQDWLARASGNAATRNLAVTLVYGADDAWSVETPVARAIYPQAKIVTLPPGGQHDLHDSKVQQGLKTLFSGDDNGSAPVQKRDFSL